MTTDNPAETSTTSGGRDVRRLVAVPIVALALALVGVGIYQLTGGDDGTDAQVPTEVGGSRVQRDDLESSTTVTEAPTTTVVVGDADGLEVSGDQNQVGLLQPQTEER